MEYFTRAEVLRLLCECFENAGDDVTMRASVLTCLERLCVFESLKDEVRRVTGVIMLCEFLGEHSHDADVSDIPLVYFDFLNIGVK